MSLFTPPFRITLRGKLTLFISVMVIGACCGLSWYLITQQAQSLRVSLIRTGTLLTKRLASTSQFSVISQDILRLKLLSAGTLAIPEIQYVRFLGPNGTILYTHKKNDQIVVPAPSRLSQIDALSLSDQHITPYHVLEHRIQPTDGHLTTLQLLLLAVGSPPHETIFDLLSPIRPSTTPPSLNPSLLEDLAMTEQRQDLLSDSTPPFHGHVQIGISNQSLQQELTSTIRQVALITLMVILLALSMAIFFSGRLVTPLKSLTWLATRVSKGDLGATVQPATSDEIGELTQSFNHMVQSLDHRDRVLEQQLQRVKTVNQTGTAINSSLDLTTVLDTVLDLLVKNLGFERTLLMLYDPDSQQAFSARMRGVQQDVADAAREKIIPIVPNDTIPSIVLLSKQSLLIPDLEDYAPRIHPLLLQLVRSMEATSFMIVPLVSQQRVLGFVGACRDIILSTQEDLELLATIGSQVGAAIDNAQTYQKLESMMQTLEQRVQERTHELCQANEKLRELDRLKSAVVTSVSHELRTPLTSIQMHVDNVLDGGTGPLRHDQKNFLTRVRNNTNRLRRIINEMLDLSRIESGQSTLTMSSVSFVQLLADVLDNLEPLIKEHQLSVETNCDPTLPRLHADADKLHQVLTNLLHNAIKFSSPHTPIYITATVNDSQMLQVCIADSGPGIPTEDISKIFLPFYRSSLTIVKGRGAGLGLAITKGLVEIQGGDLWVESTTGSGSKFFFRIPVAGISASAVTSESLTI